MPALLQAADQAFSVYIERLGSRLHGLRKRVLDPGASSTGQPAPPEMAPTSDGEGQPADALQLAQESAAALPMLNVAGEATALFYSRCIIQGVIMPSSGWCPAPAHMQAA